MLVADCLQCEPRKESIPLKKPQSSSVAQSLSQPLTASFLYLPAERGQTPEFPNPPPIGLLPCVCGMLGIEYSPFIK
jgi:hypothetical protein